MKPWEVLDRVAGPDGGEIVLSRRGGEFVISTYGYRLMSSRAHRSEEAMAEIGCARLRHVERARVLVGGLGLGYTLRAALDRLGPAAQVIVAEIVPAVVTWQRGHLGHLAGHPLADPRVIVEVSDVGVLLREAQRPFDAILLDVDNGTRALTARSNDWLYGREGLASTRRALKPHGVLAIWSASPDRAFERRLRSSGFEVTTEEVSAHGTTQGTRHRIYVARRTQP